MKKVDEKLGTWIKIFGGMIAGLWNHFHPLMQALLMLMVFDLITSGLAAIISGRLSSKVAYRDTARKAMILVMVSATEIMVKHATMSSGFPEIPAGSAVAGFYCVYYLLRIHEHVALAGLPLPPGVKNTLERLTMRTKQSDYQNGRDSSGQSNDKRPCE